MAETKEKLEIWYADVTHTYINSILRTCYVNSCYKRGEEEFLTN